MKHIQYIEVTPNGKIVNAGTAYVDTLENIYKSTSNNCLVETPDKVNPYETYYDQESVITFSPKPSTNHVFDYNIKQWVDPRTLDDLKLQQWEAIKVQRTTAEYAGFTWDGSVFDSDAISQQRIAGAVQLATLSSLFTINWTLADNTVRTLNQQQMLAVGLTLGYHINTVFTKGQALRSSIESASTKEAIESICW